jgi:hypothetical protein
MLRDAWQFLDTSFFKNYRVYKNPAKNDAQSLFYKATDFQRL